MGEQTFVEKIVSWYDSFVYKFFVKKYLDKTFGKREYWGDFICRSIDFCRTASTRECPKEVKEEIERKLLDEYVDGIIAKGVLNIKKI